MGRLLKNLILNVLVNHKAEGAAEVPSEWVWVTGRHHKASLWAVIMRPRSSKQSRMVPV